MHITISDNNFGTIMNLQILIGQQQSHEQIAIMANYN
jgi:hypothetical protein